MGILGRLFGKKDHDDSRYGSRDEQRDAANRARALKGSYHPEGDSYDVYDKKGRGRFLDRLKEQRAESRSVDHALREKQREIRLQHEAAHPTRTKINRVVGNIGRGLARTARDVAYSQSVDKGGRVTRRYAPAVSGRTGQAIAKQFGARVPGNYQGKRGQSGRGRPRGPSGRYFIPGKGPVGVYEWRKWYRRQRAMQNLQNAQQQANGYQQQPQGGYADSQSAPQSYQQAPQQPNQYQQQQVPQPQQMQSQNQGPQSPSLFNTNRFGAQANGQQAQTGVKLWDDSFMKLDSGKSNIPQGQQSMMDKTFNPETPVNNPQGDYYTEPDFFSGKQVLRQRSGDRLFKW